MKYPYINLLSASEISLEHMNKAKLAEDWSEAASELMDALIKIVGLPVVKIDKSEIDGDGLGDKVHVVRCRDCKYAAGDDKVCLMWLRQGDPDFYCAGGERRERII